MQTKSKTRRLGPPSFDVTCVIGTVELTGDGPMSPHEAAFALIAQHDAPGEYTFPMADGRTCRVGVAYEPNPLDA